MKRLISVPAAAAIALAAGLCAQAQTQKIAVLNMQDAMVSTKDGQKAVADLRAKYSPKDQEMQKRQQELTAKQDQYRKGQNTMSAEAKAALEREIDSMQRSLQRDMDDVKQDMDGDQQRMVNDLGSKMMQVINKYASDNQFAMVFDVSGQPNNILFASTAVDITREIIALYDKSAPVTPPSAPPANTTSKPAVTPGPAPATVAPKRTATAPATPPK